MKVDVPPSQVMNRAMMKRRQKKMRPIKFRFYIPSDSKMIYSDNHPAKMTGDDLIEDEDWKVMQYTGLKADNGTGEEIYAGDIVYLAGLGDTVIEFPFIELYEAMAENDVGAIMGNIHEHKIND